MRKGRLLLFELLQQCPCTLFLYGEPFYAKARFGWNPAQIALSQALIGLSIAIGAMTGGQITHRAGSRAALILGMTGSAASSLLAVWADHALSAPILLLAVALFALCQSIVWPAVEAAMMDGEPPERVQHLVGYFNLVWSFGTATAFLAATPLMTRFGLGIAFTLPAALLLFNLVFTLVALPLRPVAAAVAVSVAPHGVALTARQRRSFRMLGWLANPMAYVAINVVVTYNPVVATRLGLGFATASIWCSIWFYARTAAFELLRRWSWWHYRWGFLCGAYALATLCFAVILMAGSIWLFVGAEVVFGLCAGLIYQSSLFYSMAGSESQGAHGGFHESFIGLGQMAGPLVILAGAQVSSARSTLPIWLVVGLMGLGLAALLAVGRHTRRP